ncbi:MAG: hypothetical protein ACP5NZ_04630 [Nanobdellota archaeon]
MGWNNLDIGKIIVCKGKNGFFDKIAIYNVYNEIPNTLGFVDYPFNGNLILGQMGVIKDNQKENKESLQNPGDWYLVGEVSKDERRILEGLVKMPKREVVDEEIIFNPNEKIDNAFLEYLLVKCQSD